MQFCGLKISKTSSPGNLVNVVDPVNVLEKSSKSYCWTCWNEWSMIIRSCFRQLLCFWRLDAAISHAEIYSVSVPALQELDKNANNKTLITTDILWQSNLRLKQTQQHSCALWTRIRNIINTAKTLIKDFRMSPGCYKLKLWLVWIMCQHRRTESLASEIMKQH